MAKNTYYLHLRKNKKVVNTATYENYSMLSNEKIYEKKEMINNILKIINYFKKLNHDVMIYRIFFNMPYSEISKLLEIQVFETDYR